MATIKIKNNIKFPDLNIMEYLEIIAERIVIPEIVGRIQNREDIRGRRYPPLEKSTIKIKEKKRRGTIHSSPDHPLIGIEGKLHRSFKFKRKGKTVRLFLDNERSEVGRILQNEGVKSKRYGRRRFNFFGVNNKMEAKAVKFVEEQIERLTRA